VSIIVNNHNYASFLAEAIASALAQRDENVEVVVVDDGSTDCSREIIAGFGRRVRAVLQEHLGQKAAFNAGFLAASGDVVIFLDADDELAPHAASAVASAFAMNPDAGRVIFRLQAIDGAGRPTGALVPPSRLTLPDGDVRPEALCFPDDLPWPPTSGNAFARWTLARILPLPLDDSLVDADFPLHALTPLLAPVVALDCICGAYRLHADNAHGRQRSAIERSQYLLRIAADSHAAADRLARSLGYGPARPRSVTIVAHRLVSLRLGRSAHPIKDDNRCRALAAGARAALGRSDIAVPRRLLYLTWFVAVALAPCAVVRILARRLFRSGR
jgi:glycosyltransferase involved in cell wall biosynthesis